MIDSTVEGGENVQYEKMAGLSVEFLLAGYETTCIVLCFTSHLLAMNTDVQEKLQAEIDEYFEEDPVNTANKNGCVYIILYTLPLHFVTQEASLYEASQKLKYLDMVIQETMRFYTPITRYYTCNYNC